MYSYRSIYPMYALLDSFTFAKDYLVAQKATAFHLLSQAMDKYTASKL